MEHSKTIVIRLPDGSEQNWPEGTTPLQICENLSGDLKKKALVALLDEDSLVDLTYPLSSSCRLRILTWEDELGKKVFWHSSAHVLAQAIKNLYPESKLAVGPPLAQGFYYDVDFEGDEFSSKDVVRLETEINRLLRRPMPFTRSEVPIAVAKSLFSAPSGTYKLEILDRIEDLEVSLYEQGGFLDLCRGPHLVNTAVIKAMKILNIAGAYWQGDATEKQLTRIYGISFPKQSMLEEFLKNLEEAKRRDHRQIGKDLELFTFSSAVGMGLPLWLPKGTLIRQKLVEFLSRLQEDLGYQQVTTPHIASKKLYEISGHYQKYSKDTFQSIKSPDEGEEFLLKPMNCPHHCEIYKSKPRSYKNLPLRIAEFGTVYRYEQSGEVHGLTRVRGFTQDDAHIFCMPEQLSAEFGKVLDLTLYVIKVLGFSNVQAQLSFRDPLNPEKYMGSAAQWALAEGQIKEVCEQKGLAFKVVLGEAAFYGPKLDFMIQDALKRSWQLGTIQVDYNLPERFDLSYIDQSNSKARPVMIHRAPFGSLERLVALLLEHTNGHLPLFLAPVQVKVLPVSDKHVVYAKRIVEELKKANIRVELDDRGERLGKKIRDAQLERIPYMIVLGDEEVQNGLISVRINGSHDLNKIKLTNFTDQIINNLYLPKEGSVL